MRVVQKIILYASAIALGIFLGRWGIEFPSVGIGHVILFFIFVYLHVYIHEAGHAFCGRAAGIRVSRVIIGGGRRTLARFSFAGVPFEITPGFRGGFTYVGEVPERNLKARFFFFVLGGVLFNALAATAVWAAAYPVLGAARGGYADVFIYAGLLMVVLNLLPLNIYAMGIKIPYDGLKLLKTPFMKEADIRTLLAAGKTQGAFWLIRERDFDGAEKALLEARRYYPDSESLEINLAVVFIKQNRLEEAKEVLEALVDREKSPYFYIVCNNLAYTCMLMDDGALLEAADRYSLKAYNYQKKLSNFRVTRGCVLVLLGRVDEGLSLLKKYASMRKGVDANLENLDPFMFTALGFFLKGNTEEAAQYMRKASLVLARMSPSERAIHDRIRRRIGVEGGAAEEGLAP